jgi:hypothetical protein
MGCHADPTVAAGDCDYSRAVVDSRETVVSSWTRSGMRTFLTIPALILAANLAANLAVASNGSSSLLGRHGHAELSKFDYLVLASMADSPSLTAMASYRPRVQPGASGSLARSVPKRQ